MNEYDLPTKEEQEAAQERLMREHQLADDFRGIMATDGGRRFVWFMLQESGCFRATPVDNHAEMAYREGRRNWGLMLISKIQTDCPHQYQVMTNESTIKSDKGE